MSRSISSKRDASTLEEQKPISEIKRLKVNSTSISGVLHDGQEYSVDDVSPTSSTTLLEHTYTTSTAFSSSPGSSISTQAPVNSSDSELTDEDRVSSTASRTSTFGSSSISSSSSDDDGEPHAPSYQFHFNHGLSNSTSPSSSSSASSWTSSSASSSLILSPGEQDRNETFLPTLTHLSRPTILPRTHALQLNDPQDIQSRVSSLLPALASANEQLEIERQEGRLDARDIENLGEDELGDAGDEYGGGKPYIEMNLGLGVLKQKIDKSQRKGTSSLGLKINSSLSNSSTSSSSSSSASEGTGGDEDDEMNFDDPANGALSKDRDVLEKLMGRKGKTKKMERPGIEVLEGA
ncbi:hypothetical protein MMC09_003250 [Bachmanniomyces sp. S44760]|nr:hypothetical protein [Bachmanniomyces sp. S44760]